jgi:solute carrier family 45 protein 1/2/4
MEFLKELDEEPADPKPNSGRAGEIVRRARGRAISSPQIYTDTTNERQPLIRRHTHEEYEAAVEESGPAAPVAGGTVLGIHNLAIVFPQFVIALVSSAIFHAVDADIAKDPTNHDTYLGKNGVAWVLRFGGLCTLFGAIFARMVPPTRTERDMRRMLAEMKELREENTP